MVELPRMAQLPLSEGPSRGNKWRHVVRNEIKGRLSKFVNLVIATVLVLVMMFSVRDADRTVTVLRLGSEG